MSLFVFLAQTPPAAGPGGGLMQIVPFVAILAIFYFLVIRPQQREQAAHRELLSGLKKGDQVVTISGLHGKIWEVRDNEVVLEIADKVRVNIDKVSVKRRPSDSAGKES